MAKETRDATDSMVIGALLVLAVIIVIGFFVVEGMPISIR